MFPTDGSADAAGKFECGRYAGAYETKTIILPPDMSCEKCTLQVAWESPAGAHYTCSDVTLMNDKIRQCIGKCQNDGACVNGACVCNEPYTGEFCQYKSTARIPTLPQIDKEETRVGYWWLVFIVLVLLAAGFFAGAYFLKNKGRQGEHPPIPFIEEQVEEHRPPPQEEPKQAPVEVVKEAVEEPIQEPVQEQEAKPEHEEAPAPAEVEEPQQENKEPVGNVCPNGHDLVVSKSQVGYPGGYYMCASCQKVLQCSAGRWNCQTCGYDICPECKPIVDVPEQEPEPAPESKLPLAAQPEEEDKGEVVDPRDALSPVELDKDIKLVLESKQEEAVAKEFFRINSKGKATWRNTHFIFVIDCSGSMKGLRWDSVKAGYKRCLEHLGKMKDVLISAFTFDDGPNPFVREKPPGQAVLTADKIPFTGKGTNYKRALEFAMGLVDRAHNKDYLSCVLFLSDGMGGFPEDAMKHIANLKDAGKKILFYTIACVTTEDDDMIKMDNLVRGAHYAFDNPETARRVFSAILKL